MPQPNAEVSVAESALFTDISKMLAVLRNRLELVNSAIESLERYERAQARFASGGEIPDGTAYFPAGNLQHYQLS